MSKLNFFCFLSFLIFLIGACEKNISDPVMTNEGDNKTGQILFIGNSHTSYNNLPSIVELIAASMNDTLEVHTFTSGGARFQTHATSVNLNFKIESQKWDYVILQEAANFACLPEAQAIIDVIPPADNLVDKIEENHINTQLLFYLTHTYNDDSSGFDDLPNVSDFNTMLEEIRRNYLLMETRYDAQIAPAGVIWNILRNELVNIELHHLDTIHPNELGSFVSACSIYVAMSGNALQAAYHPSTISNTLANQIFSLVNATILEDNPDWRTY